MSYITKNLNQTATWWSALAPDGFGGASFSTPVQIRCFWEDKQLLTIDKFGNQVTAEAMVYVTQDLSLGDYLYFGVSNSTSPVTVPTAKQILQFRKIPNIRCTEYERTAFLGTNRSVI